MARPPWTRRNGRRMVRLPLNQEYPPGRSGGPRPACYDRRVTDWEPFDVALRRDDHGAELLASIRRVEGWFDAAANPPWANDPGAVATPASARATYRALLLVRYRQMRALGLDLGPAGMTALAARMAACAGQEHASDSCGAVRRAQQAADATAALLAAHPDVVVTIASPAVEAARQALLDLGTRSAPAIAACGMGLVTTEGLSAVEAVLGEYDALAAHFPADDDLRRNLDYSRGHVALTLARGAGFLNQQAAAALGWYTRAADAFAAAGDPARATGCRVEADTVRARVAADLDADAARALGAVIDPTADPLDRAARLAALARQNGAAGDYFGASGAAAEATAVLGKAGIPDPETTDVDAMAAGLFAAAAARAGGMAFFQLCSTTVATWTAVAQARMFDPARGTPEKARAESLTAVLAAFADQLVSHQAAVIAAQDAALAPYGVAAHDAAFDAAAEQTRAWQAAVLAYDARVEAVLEACWARETGTPCDDLAAEALTLEAASAGLPVLQRARCRLLTAGVHMRQADAAACTVAVDEVIALVLEGRPPVPESFPSSNERQIYLDALWTRAMGLLATDPSAALAACVDAVTLVEALRARVSDPYQQSAFLVSTAWAYEYGVGIARRLGVWDTMLGIMDAAKARAVLRRGPPPSAAALQALREIDADPDPTHRERRWSLQAVTRALPAAPPPPTLAAVQSALAADEVVLAYFWVLPNLLVVAAIDAEGIAVDRVAIDDDTVEQLTGYTTLLAAETVNISAAGFFRAFGAQIIPESCRARMRGKRRLIVSPHRALHLFPFHATQWDGAPLIRTFTVRYVPNLGSLLLPWTGPTGGPVLSVGCGTFVGPGAPGALADAEPEARAVASAYTSRDRPVTLLTGEDASRARVQALAPDLPGYSAVHLATHGLSVLSPAIVNDPLATRVYLHDGTLDGISLAALGLQAELVVFAVCNSGQRAIAGRGLAELPGDDVLGIQAALFGSGVRCLLGALWPVKSQASSRIMPSLHAALAGGAPPDVALQTAVCDYLSHPEYPQHPIYWASFYLVELGRPSLTNPAIDA